MGFGTFCIRCIVERMAVITSSPLKEAFQVAFAHWKRVRVATEGRVLIFAYGKTPIHLVHSCLAVSKQKHVFQHTVNMHVN